jgi:hypothetical protein
LTSPHSANIDCTKVEQQCGGILTRLQPVYARGMEFWKRISGIMHHRGTAQGVDPQVAAGYASNETQENRKKLSRKSRGKTQGE